MTDPASAIRNNVGKQRFEADLGDGSLAIADYRLGEGTIAFTHTEVPAAHRGHGIGTALILFALEWARDRGLKVAPFCPFVAAYMKANKEWQDLLAPSWGKALGPL